MRPAILLTVFCSVLIVGCGQSAEEKRQQEARARAALEARRERRARARATAIHGACSKAFGGLQDTLSELDSRLAVGLTYEKYGTAVADVQVEYDKIDFKRLRIPHGGEFDCLGAVGVPLERALNQYASAYTAWNACFEDIYCDIDSIDVRLQAHWRKASRAVERSRDGLAGLEPPANGEL